jgi:DNA-directed RNA polymerase specialized sigma24 family protein
MNAHAPVTASTCRPVAELYASEQEGLRRLARLLTGSDAMAEDLV